MATSKPKVNDINPDWQQGPSSVFNIVHFPKVNITAPVEKMCDAALRLWMYKNGAGYNFGVRVEGVKASDEFTATLTFAQMKALIVAFTERFMYLDAEHEKDMTCPTCGHVRKDSNE